MSDSIQRRIVIVGAGFSGTATAARLLRIGSGHSLDVVLVERGPEFGRGIAYARGNFPYLLNVPASRMSATTQDPEDFLRFAQRRNASVTGEDFLPRSLYGQYLNEHLDAAVAAARGTVRLERVRGEAVDIEPRSVGRPAAIVLADGTRITADFVVLAPGFQAPCLPRSIRCSLEPPAIRPSPWSDGRVLPGPGRVLILGTGLTMVDVVSEALARHPDVEIHAISRRGLVPPSQTAFHPDALPDDDRLLMQSAHSVRQLVAAVRRLAREAASRGGDWREVITLVRRNLPFLWETLGIEERRRFLRHVQSYWDIHRHRLPGPVHARIEQLRESGQLVIHAGRVLVLERSGDAVRVTWRARRESEPRVMHAAEVVDCTGPNYDLRDSPERLWQSLTSRGLAVADDLRLGVRTAAHGALVGRDGVASDHVYYIGPMLRADHWEATAVGELRVHADALARHLVAGL